MLNHLKKVSRPFEKPYINTSTLSQNQLSSSHRNPKRAPKRTHVIAAAQRCHCEPRDFFSRQATPVIRLLSGSLRSNYSGRPAVLAATVRIHALVRHGPGRQTVRAPPAAARPGPIMSVPGPADLGPYRYKSSQSQSLAHARAAGTTSDHG